MSEEKRITLRIDQSEFEQLDDFRHSKRLTWQGLLMGLVRQWAEPANAIDQEQCATDISYLPPGKQMLAQRFLELDARDMALALQLLKWWRTPGDRTTQRVIKAGVAISLRDDHLMRQAELQGELDE